MSIEAILQELPRLDSTDLRRIRDLMNSLEDQRNPEYRKEMARRIDDKDPSHWIALEELEKRLNLREDNAGE